MNSPGRISDACHVGTSSCGSVYGDSRRWSGASYIVMLLGCPRDSLHDRVQPRTDRIRRHRHGGRVDDGPVGRVADVERLLQLLALLRNSDGGWVALATLRSGVTAYRNSTTEDALERMIQRDLESLRKLGFAIEGETQEGTPARYRLKATAWRVPLDLDGHEQRLLAWVMAVAGASRDELAATSSLPPAPTSEPLGSLLGSMPPALDVIHTALASRRQVIIHHNGADKTIEPAQLSVQQ